MSDESRSSISEKNKEIALKIIEKVWDNVTKSRFIVLIIILAFWVKLAFIHSIDMWDEGWYVSVTSRISLGLNDPLFPLYYPNGAGNIVFFDKPPFAFWVGATLMNILGYTTVAAKGTVIIGGALLAAVVYFLYSHQEENKSAHIIAGLFVAISYFLTFYSRTAYIDAFVVFMSAIVMLFAVRAIDAVFKEKNLKKGYILMVIAFILNCLNLLTKAWQGLLVAPGIGIYLFIRYFESRVDTKSILQVFKDSWKNKNYKEHPNNYLLLLIVAFLSTLIASFFVSSLLLASLILALISTLFTFQLVNYFELDKKFEISDDKSILISTLIVLLVGLISGIIGGLGSGIFYNRFESAIISIINFTTLEDLPAPIDFKGYLGFLMGFNIDWFATFLDGIQTFAIFELISIVIDYFFMRIFGILLLEIIVSVIGIVLVAFVTLFGLGLFMNIVNKKDTFIDIFYQLLDIIPLGVLGLGFVAWFLFLLADGDEGTILDLGILSINNRQALPTVALGIFLLLFLTIIITEFPSLKEKITRHFNSSKILESNKDRKIFESQLLFLGVAVTLIIISFYPLIAWIEYLDFLIGNDIVPWEIRTPGELVKDTNRPNPITYAFLFYEYYIGWRYEFGTSYEVAPSIGSALNDYSMFVVAPFALIGLYAFYFSKKKNPALGSLLIAWIVSVLFIFLPAQFQLNYYYIPLAIPYFAIAAKGFEFIYSSKEDHFIVRDNIERLLASGYFFLEAILLYILPYSENIIIQLFNLVTGKINLNVFFSHFDNFGMNLFFGLLIIIPTAILAFRVLDTFPGIITAGLAVKMLISQYLNHSEKLYHLIFRDILGTIVSVDINGLFEPFELGAPLNTLIGLVLIIFGLFWLRKNVKFSGIVILSLLLPAMMMNVSVLSHYNQIFDLHFQEMGMYINDHGGNYNYSTWVIDDAGAQFAMRYYLGNEVEREGRNYPFSSNSTFAVTKYFSDNPNIKFWIIVNNSKLHDVEALASDYPETYRWFTSNEHIVCVDEYIGVTSWWKIHLFVNKTYIVNELGLSLDWK